MSKYLRVYKKLIDIGFSVETQYRKDALLNLFVQGIQFATAFLFVEAVYGQTAIVQGWEKGEIYMLTIMVDLQNKFFVFFFQGNFNYMEQLIHTGKFDFLLTKPISPLFYATNRLVRVRALYHLLFSLVFVTGISVHFGLSLGVSGIIRSIFMGICGMGMMYAVSLLVNCFLFRNSQIGNVNNILGEARYQGRYPLDIFPRPLYIFFATIIPVAFFGFFATAALFNKLDSWMYAFAAIFSSLVMAASIFVWNRQVRYYSSASS